MTSHSATQRLRAAKSTPSPRERRHPVTRASPLEVGDWHTGAEVDAHVRTLFLTRQAIGFSALSKRSLFRGHFDYCNYDTYSLVVQRYQQGSNAGMFSFNTRRRDGSTGHMWSSDEFAFHRPNHVDGRAKFDLDRPLLEALLTLGDAAPALLEAMREFNSANTDLPLCERSISKASPCAASRSRVASAYGFATVQS